MSERHAAVIVEVVVVLVVEGFVYAYVYFLFLFLLGLLLVMLTMFVLVRRGTAPRVEVRKGPRGVATPWIRSANPPERFSKSAGDG